MHLENTFKYKLLASFFNSYNSIFKFSFQVSFYIQNLQMSIDRSDLEKRDIRIWFIAFEITFENFKVLSFWVDSIEIRNYQ